MVVPWNDMRNRWVSCAAKRNKVDEVKRYFNTFATKNPGYTFIVAKKFNDLHDVCVTKQQCSEIKRTLERNFGLSGYLLDASFLEVSLNECTKKSFRNDREFREFREHTINTMNRPVIRAKHQEARQHYQKVKNAFENHSRKAFEILCFDIEVYEHDHSVMLEIGYVICCFSPSFNAQKHAPELVTKHHLIIQDNLRFKNGDKVPDKRNWFMFGESETLSLVDAVRKFATDVRRCDYVLGHSVQHDEAYLRNIGVDLSRLGKELFDTQVVQAYKESISNSDKYFMRGLSYLLKEYKLNYQDSYLHNGGCDAFYTMMVFLRQMGYSEENVNSIIMAS